MVARINIKARQTALTPFITPAQRKATIVEGSEPAHLNPILGIGVRGTEAVNAGPRRSLTGGLSIDYDGDAVGYLS